MKKRPTPAMAVAFAALFAALSGIAVAGPSLPGTGRVHSNDIHNNQIRTQDIRTGHVRKSDVGGDAVGKSELREEGDADGGLTSAHIVEGSLSKVPSAAFADAAAAAGNANTVGGTPLSGLLRTAGCQTGKVLGFARIKGSAAVPATYTSDPAFIDITHNCSGGPVQIRRSSTGHFLVRFVGNPAALSVVSANTDIDVFAENNIVASGKITTGPDAGAFEVTFADEPANVFTDAGQATILLP